jgi:autotransporter-associated beta strand protein
MQTSPFILSLAGLRRRVFTCLMLTVLLGTGAAPVFAATRTWTGGHASSANWNLRDNWGGIAVPAHGDTLVFPDGAARFINTNNIPGLRLSAIQFTGPVGGYNLRGGGVIVTNGITLIEGSVQTISFDAMTLGDTQSFFIPLGGALTFNSALALNGFDLHLSAIGDISVRGAVSGNGNITKSGAGQLSLFGDQDNVFNGSLTVTSGTLAMNRKEATSIVPLVFESRIAVPGNLILGNGSSVVVATAQFDDQISETSRVTVANSATLDLNGHQNTVGDIILSGGEINTGAGTLYVNGDITANASSAGSVISGHLALFQNTVFTVADGPASTDLTVSAGILALTGIIKEGEGTLRFSGTNGYFGTTVINAGALRISNDSALGSPNSGTTVNDGAELFLETGVDTLREPLTIMGEGMGGTNGAIRLGSAATIATNLVLSAPGTIHTMSGGNLVIDGVISGTGPLSKTGPGTLRLAGNSANAFTGGLLAREGLVLLAKTTGNAVPGILTIGEGETDGATATARHLGSSQVGATVTVNPGSLYDLNGHDEACSHVVLNGGGDVVTGTGQLFIGSSLTANAGALPFGSTSTIDGQLTFGDGGVNRTITVAETGGFVGDGADLVINAHISGNIPLVKLGQGDLSLTASNSFLGTLTVEEGELRISNDHALGSTAANTVLTGNSLIELSGGIVVDEYLFLNGAGKTNVGVVRSQGSNVWDGTILLAQTAIVNVPTNSTLNISGVINGLAGLTKTGPGVLVYSGTAANTYVGTTRVNQGILRLGRTGGSNRAIQGPLVIGDGVGADVVETFGNESQIQNQAPVTIDDSGLLVLNSTAPSEGIGSLAGAGRVEMNDQILETGFDNTSTLFAGVIVGNGDLYKRGAGVFTLTHTNIYTGDTLVREGTLAINGHQPSSDVYVDAGATLKGTGYVGNLFVDGTLAPGDNLGYFGAKDVALKAGSDFQVELVSINSDYAQDHMSVTDVDITGATLNASLGFAPPAGHQFVILQKWTVGPITGTFNGLPEGAQLIVDGIPFRITYTGGDGANDIILAVDDLPLRVGSTRLEGGNGNGRVDPNECDHLFVTIENTSGAAINGVTAHLDALDPRIMITQAESLYGDIPAFSSRTNRAAFQIRIAPGYPCGSAVDLHLVIESANHAPFALPVRLLAGSPGELQIVQSTDVPRVIPDLGVAQSTIDWPNAFYVGKVRVTAHVTHPAAGDLRFRLRGPDGQEVLLSANHGGNNANYGINCARRTIFDSDAKTSIAGAAAPFEGTFAAEGDLSPFINRFPFGIWTLIVEDTVAGNLGTLQCWSLELARAECTEAGGPCESCTPRIEGSLVGVSQTLSKRLSGTGQISGCGNAKPCPEFTTNSAPYRYNTHSFTNNGPDTCVTVALFVPCGAYTNGLYSAAYLGDFNPDDPCENYLGDVGQGIHSYFGEGSAFSFPVAAGQRFTVVVNERIHLQGCDSYSLELFGLPCPEARPTLHIANDAGPDRVRLHWSTAYPGFQLQGTPGLGALTVFTNVTAAPIVVGGHYSVTNMTGSTNKGFFRLRKN